MASQDGDSQIGVERRSPLEPVYRPGSHGNFDDGVGIALSQVHAGSILQLAAWPGEEKAMIAAIRAATGLSLPDGAGGGVSEEAKSAFGFAPGKFTVTSDTNDLADTFAKIVTPDSGTVTDLSHGRTILRIEGPEAEWVLSKFFAVDFALAAFPVGAGRSTTHHDIFAQIQRSGADRFDIHVFRSFARSFWVALCHGAAEVGYEVA